MNDPQFPEVNPFKPTEAAKPAAPATPSRTDFLEVMGDLEAGAMLQRIAVALSEAALGTVTTGKKSQVILKFDMAQIADGSQVAITHNLSYLKPTMKGKVREEAAGKTPFYVGPGGKLTLFPENQADLFGRNPQ